MVENGHKAELNHVSSTSGSWVSSLLPHSGHDEGSSIAANWCPWPQVHTGIRWPHQSWREMHQSRMFSIQCKYCLLNRSGTKRMRPSLTAWIAGSASGFILTNHWSETKGSTTLPQR